MDISRISEIEESQQKFIWRCHQCGTRMDAPDQAFLLSLGDCCGLELIAFCGQDCLDRYQGREDPADPPPR